MALIPALAVAALLYFTGRLEGNINVAGLPEIHFAQGGASVVSETGPIDCSTTEIGTCGMDRTVNISNAFPGSSCVFRFVVYRNPVACTR